VVVQGRPLARSASPWQLPCAPDAGEDCDSGPDHAGEEAAPDSPRFARSEVSGDKDHDRGCRHDGEEASDDDPSFEWRQAAHAAEDSGGALSAPRLDAIGVKPYGNPPARLSEETGGLPIFPPIQRAASTSAPASRPVSKPARPSM